MYSYKCVTSSILLFILLIFCLYNSSFIYENIKHTIEYVSLILRFYNFGSSNKVPLSLVKDSSYEKTLWNCIGSSSDYRSCQYRYLYLYNGMFEIFLTKNDVKPNDLEIKLSNDPKRIKLSNTSIPADDYIEDLWKPEIRQFETGQEMQKFISQKNVIILRNVHIAYKLSFIYNIGHALFDSLYPAYYTLVKFGMENSNFSQILFGKGSNSNVRTIDKLNIFKIFGDVNSELFLFDILSKQSKMNPNTLWCFENILFGIGGVGNMYPSKSIATLGSELNPNAIQLFRNRMYDRYSSLELEDCVVDRNSYRRVPQIDQELKIVIVGNKRYSSYDEIIINKTISFLNNKSNKLNVSATFVDWSKLKSHSFHTFACHLSIIQKTDIMVSSVGTALMYAPFLRDRSVFINLGEIFRYGDKIFPSFMEQQLTGGAVRYFATLYGDPGKAIRNGNASKLLNIMPPNLQHNTAALDFDIMKVKLEEAIGLARSNFTIPRLITDNLSPEGKVMYELCLLDESLCDVMTYDRRRCPTIAVWLEFAVYEIGEWHEGGQCHLNYKILQNLRVKYNLLNITNYM